MGFNHPSPESDDPAKKSAPAFDYSGFQLPLAPADRKEADWRKPLQTQKSSDYLPSLEVHQSSDPRTSLPLELQVLYGDLSGKPGTQKQNDASVQPTADRVSASPVKFDQAGYASDITYPNGKSRHIDRDAQSHEAKAITTTNSEGTTRLVNQNGNWFMEVQGMQLPFPGKVEVAKNGDVAMQTGANGVWRVEKTDGSISEEKENADGARISFDAAHNLSRITRKDGTTYQQIDQNTISESHPGGKNITWTNLGGLWSSDGGDKPRKNMALHDNASVTFSDANGVKHTINGLGAETLEGAGLGKITPDAQNRVSEVETADGKKVRKYDYFEGSSDIKTVSIIDKTNNSSTVYTRESKDSSSWRSDRGGSWSGEIRVSPDGVHSIKAGTRGESDGKWTSYYPDGRETSDVINSDNSRASYDKQNNLVNYQGSDGVRIDRLNVGGQETIRYYDPKAGETITWTKGGDGFWSADSAQYKDARKDLSFNTNGEFSYTNERGGRVEEHRDGTRQITEKDGTRLEFDREGQIIKATQGNLERTFIRDTAGIALVKDRNLTNKQERTIFERRPAGEENRSNIHVSRNGDLSYQNPDGTAVIERSNMLHLELDKDGDLTRVVGPKSTRQFQYIGDADHKAVVSIVDTKYNEKGQAKVETWTRVANVDGTLSNEFRSFDEKGKERKSRYNITPCADGEYEYRLATDKPGEKAHVEKLNSTSSDMPASIEEARERLTSILEGVMDKSRLQANIGYMKGFEQRMLDQSELQIAAGINPEKVAQETTRCIVDTYNNCAKLAGTARGANEMYGLNDRVRLAENLLYLANDPTDIKQGGQGTCWWESSWNVGLFQRNAGDAARFCADIALTRQYTSTAGPLRGGGPKTLKVPAQYVGLGGYDSGRGWTPKNSHQSSQRSMVGMLIDQCGPPLGGQRGWGQSNAGWHTEARNILYMMTGRDNIRHGGFSLGQHEKVELLKTGGWTASGSNHMWAYTMHKDHKTGEWVVIKDDQYQGGDHVIQRIRDLKSWISSNTRSEVQKGWRAHPFRRGDNQDVSPLPIPSPSPRPNPQPDRNTPVRPSDDDDDNYNNNDNNNDNDDDSNDDDSDDDDDGGNYVQFARPIWQIARRFF